MKSEESLDGVRPGRKWVCAACGPGELEGMASRESDDEEGEIRGEVEEFDGEDAYKISADKGTRIVRRLLGPRRPTLAEVELHDLHHVPYRNWCPCVRGFGKNLDHRRAVDVQRDLCEYHFDYCFPGDEFGFKLTILVGKEKVGGMCMATAVPTKGTNCVLELEKVKDFIQQCGDETADVIIKTDQEPSDTVLDRGGCEGED